MDYWHDKVALVTGGSSGLGLALSAALVNRGARVVMLARDRERLESAAHATDSTGQLQTIRADVTRDEDVSDAISQVIARHQRLDALFHCVGASDRGEVLKTPIQRYQELWELNFISAIRCAQAAAPALQQARGHLVLIGSLASKLASRYLGAYPASKFPLAALAQQLRLEAGTQGFHVLLVCPGPIARADAGQRYEDKVAGLPQSARQPGGGVKLKGINSHRLADQILSACKTRRRELVIPRRARLLCAISQLSPALGDWLVRKFT